MHIGHVNNIKVFKALCLMFLINKLFEYFLKSNQQGGA